MTKQESPATTDSHSSWIQTFARCMSAKRSRFSHSREYVNLVRLDLRIGGPCQAGPGRKAERASDAFAGASRRDRWRSGGLLRALSPHETRHKRCAAARARRSDVRLDMACGGRISHAQRRSQRGQAAGIHDQSLPGDRGRVGPGDRRASVGRRDAGLNPRSFRLAEDGACAQPLSRRRDGADLGQGSEEAFSPAR